MYDSQSPGTPQKRRATILEMTQIPHRHDHRLDPAVLRVLDRAWQRQVAQPAEETHQGLVAIDETHGVPAADTEVIGGQGQAGGERGAAQWGRHHELRRERAPVRKIGPEAAHSIERGVDRTGALPHRRVAHRSDDVTSCIDGSEHRGAAIERLANRALRVVRMDLVAAHLLDVDAIAETADLALQL